MYIVYIAANMFILYEQTQTCSPQYTHTCTPPYTHAYIDTNTHQHIPHREYEEEDDGDMKPTQKGMLLSLEDMEWLYDMADEVGMACAGDETMDVGIGVDEMYVGGWA